MIITIYDNLSIPIKSLTNIFLSIIAVLYILLKRGLYHMTEKIVITALEFVFTSDLF